VGLGNGTQKLFYLPDAHTDFIFSVMGEELGMVGCYVFLFLLLLFVVTGVRVALRAPDAFGVFLACGLTFLVGLQMAVNVGISLGLLPTKGMALPFLSYGGSSLLTTLMAVGLLISIARHGVMRSRPRT
jgi:cell division protein FtsW